MLRFSEHFSVVPRFVDAFGKLVIVTAATKRLLKALQINNEEILSVENRFPIRIYKGLHTMSWLRTPV